MLQQLKKKTRYNFVTPLTSIVVLKDKHREEMEQKLNLKEPTEPTAAPLSVINMNINTLDEEQAVDWSSYPRYNYRPTALPSYGGVYTHVVLPLKPGINLCFNWNGKHGEVCLLHVLSYDIIF